MKTRLVATGRWAFSLTELLVVIVLLAVMLALLVPAAHKAGELSRLAQCATKLRQLGTQTLLAMGEHDGALPWYEGPKGRPGMWWYRVHQRENFVNFSEKMTCPSVKHPYQYWYRHEGQLLFGNYRYNKYMGYQHHASGAWIYPLVRLQTISEPGRLVLLADDRSILADRTDDSTGFEAWSTVDRAHRGGTVGVFFCLDGHIEQMTGGQVGRLVMVPQYLR